MQSILLKLLEISARKASTIRVPKMRVTMCLFNACLVGVLSVADVCHREGEIGGEVVQVRMSLSDINLLIDLASLHRLSIQYMVVNNCFIYHISSSPYIHIIEPLHTSTVVY